ncbi:hypothetical protein ACFE04_017814 [Oxalis oulophora]
MEEDLITSSSAVNSTAAVFIPQLIQNVREIIFPCNPNLAAVLEYRLRDRFPLHLKPLSSPSSSHYEHQQPSNFATESTQCYNPNWQSHVVTPPKPPRASAQPCPSLCPEAVTCILPLSTLLHHPPLSTSSSIYCPRSRDLHSPTCPRRHRSTATTNPRLLMVVSLILFLLI